MNISMHAVWHVWFEATKQALNVLLIVIHNDS